MNLVLICKPGKAKIPYFFNGILTSTVKRYFSNAVRIQMIEGEINITQLRKIIDFWRPIGAIVTASSGCGIFTRRNLKSLPTVYIDPPKATSATFNVVQDNETDAQAAALELLSPDMKHYAFVGGTISYKWSKERGTAFKEGMRAANLTCTEFKRNIPEGEYLNELAIWLKTLPKPCGIFADNDETAEKIVEVCSVIGIAIPEEVKLVGCDNNTAICESASTTISSVCPDYEKAALLCARLLKEQIQNPEKAPCTMKYEAVGLVRRASSSVIPKYDRRVASVVKMIHSRIRNGLSVADIAAELGCSARLLQIRFKKVVGTTIKKYMSDVQMENVEKMLKTTSIPIQNIAQECGYGTMASLRIQFRRKHAISMTEWRRLYHAV